MFDFDKNLVAGIGVAKIVSERDNLIYDEYPILFTGLNKHGHRVIGSYLNHDQESDDDIIYFAHLSISNNAFDSFLSKQITYRNFFEVSDEVYIVEKNYDSNTEVYYTIPIADFPINYYPSVDSFCPELNKKLGLKYNIRLTGKLADNNMAVTSQASVIANAFSYILENSINSLKLSSKVRVLQQPSTEGSFKMNFELKLPSGQQSVGVEKQIVKFQTDFLDYCLNGLGQELTSVFSASSEVVNAPNYDVIKEQFRALRLTVGSKKDATDEELNELLKKDIGKVVSSLEKAVESLGVDFDVIEFANVYSSSNKHLIKSIDQDAKIVIDSAASYIESIENDIEQDDEPKEYKIHVYHLNTDSRLGNAIVFSGDDNNRVMSKPRIKILGKSPLENTEYTNSLHSGDPVVVVAKGKRIGEKYISLEITEE
ncbi:hypothetical protein [Hymenobacter cellulosivorans]|uniref:Uncharacterized protein n=1 Tax=Hymenobacter cellulosivorans TaxID=2932249 RepID=A0ABY4FAK7_9BACT|nr:hypothetical protein [Hymenobacter cellulosivorans]UOQ53524.1 hypothetical protein MUN80_01910 [Hymenobacter cellulosivorans]